MCLFHNYALQISWIYLRVDTDSLTTKGIIYNSNHYRKLDGRNDEWLEFNGVEKDLGCSAALSLHTLTVRMDLQTTK